MANHVQSYITFENLSEEAKTFLDSMNTPDESLLKELYSDYDETRGWHIDNVGAKWLTFDDIDSTNISCTSAWSPPVQFYDKLHEKLVELNSPDAILWTTYEDEMPNFIGVYGLIKNYCHEEEMYEEDFEDCLGATAYDEVTEEFNDGVDGRPDFWESIRDWNQIAHNEFKESF
jgi:hypothetical protein|tara:strand:- start:233 stop:754 length:522 start_codon:yes stop_codon:yes gene_type:complete